MRKFLTVAGILVSSFAAGQTPINLYPGPAPGSENWTQKEVTISTSYGPVLQNVVTPTLTPYLPEKSKANGTAIIIAPGGACIGLAIEHEGTGVARWLQDKGFTAFVLKYRIPERKDQGAINFDEACKYGIADGIQAVKLVRQRVAEWGISPDRVGFVGFSAGAMVTSGVLLQPDASARPNFAAPIYGGPFGVLPAIPGNLPPIFMAWAQDDDLVNPVNRFYEALKAAGNKPEVHIYRTGGHGFGMKRQGTTSDHWIDEFYFWLDSQGLTKPAAR